MPCDALLNVRARLDVRHYQELKANPALLEQLRLYVEAQTRLRPVKLTVKPDRVEIHVNGYDLVITLSEGGIDIQAQGYAAQDAARTLRPLLEAHTKNLALALIKARAAKAIKALGRTIEDKTLRNGTRVITLDL